MLDKDGNINNKVRIFTKEEFEDADKRCKENKFNNEIFDKVYKIILEQKNNNKKNSVDI